MNSAAQIRQPLNLMIYPLCTLFTSAKSNRIAVGMLKIIKGLLARFLLPAIDFIRTWFIVNSA
ncbi:hypothetical protein CXF72_14155 [Psychromonas sp. MB-3u-54]|nr:hypothetical protein CXF72_14155 [Psychromonas sp. MB-3u-54]